MPKFKFEAHKLEEILKEYAEIREVEVPKAVLINGRLLAKELARRTQPFGTKREAAAFRTGHDIRKIIKDDDHLAEMIDKVYNERIKERLENMLRARNYEGIKQVFRKIGFLNKYGEMQILNDFRSTHQSHRNATTGRTRKNADMLYIAQGDLPGYVEETAARVGLSKAGWAVAAEDLPPTVANKRSAYDFPAFVKANISRASGSAQDNTYNLSSPTVTLTNSTPWIDRICPATERMNAVSVVIAKMKTQMAAILKKRKKAEEVAD
jgi:hypothetical protein